MVPALTLGVVVAVAAPAFAGTPAKIRTGGPSAPGEAKVAIVGSNRDLAGKRFVVIDGSGTTVGTGSLSRARGRPAPWKHAYEARLNGAGTAGSYRVRVPALDQTSRPWVVR